MINTMNSESAKELNKNRICKMQEAHDIIEAKEYKKRLALELKKHNLELEKLSGDYALDY